MSKTCTKCKMTKEYIEFFKGAGYQDGYNTWCKECMRETWRTKTYPKLKLSDNYKVKHRKQVAQYIANNPEKAQAHRLAKLHKARLKKGACEDCDSTQKLHMHHPDYSQPLHVITLCNSCHVKEHNRLRAA